MVFVSYDNGVVDEDPSGHLSPEQRRRLEQILDRLEDASEESPPTPGDASGVVETMSPGSHVTSPMEIGGGETVTARPSGPDSAPPRQQPAFIGRQIGPYRIVRVIGAGGMGQVYEAIQDSPNRSVALKLLRASIDNEQTRLRFDYEVEMLGRLQHPGIARIYDAGTWLEEGRSLPYFAMEYIANARPIDEYCRSRRLDDRERLQLFTQVCDAVSYGHERGIIHRDLKPGNILVDGNGDVKVIDFGIAKAAGASGDDEGPLTVAGQIIGTLQYMSPEQCDADPNDLDIRSDVYSLGVVLYQMLVDDLPYDLERSAIHAAITIVKEREPVAIQSVRTTIASDVSVITHKALEKDRHRRYRSAGEFGDDLRRYLADEPITARPPSFSEHVRRYARKHRGTARAVAAIAAILVVSVVAIVFFAIDADRQRAMAASEATAAREAEAATQAALDRESVARALAERRAARLRESSVELLGDLNDEIRNLPGAFDARSAFLDLSERQLQALLDEEPDDRMVRLMLAVSRIERGDLLGGTRTSSLGRRSEAAAAYVEAEGMLRALHESVPEDRIASLELARALRRSGDLLRKGDPMAALPRYLESMEIAEKALAADPDDPAVRRQVSIGLNSLAQVQLDLGDRAEADRTLARSLSIALALLEAASDDPDMRHSVAMNLRRRGHIAKLGASLDRAEAWHREALGHLDRNIADFPNDVGRLRHGAWQNAMLGEVLVLLSRSDDAVVQLRTAASRAVEGCSREPRDALQHKAVVSLVPGACDLLIEIGRLDAARDVRRLALGSLEPVVAANGDVLGLIETFTVVDAIEIDP